MRLFVVVHGHEIIVTSETGFRAAYCKRPKGSLGIRSTRVDLTPTQSFAHTPRLPADCRKRFVATGISVPGGLTPFLSGTILRHREIDVIGEASSSPAKHPPLHTAQAKAQASPRAGASHFSGWHLDDHGHRHAKANQAQCNQEPTPAVIVHKLNPGVWRTL
jgi:hypothetical protein